MEVNARLRFRNIIAIIMDGVIAVHPGHNIVPTGELIQTRLFIIIAIDTSILATHVMICGMATFGTSEQYGLFLLRRRYLMVFVRYDI